MQENCQISTWHLMYGVQWVQYVDDPSSGGKPKWQLNMKEESPGHFLNSFGIFGPSLIQPRSFRTQLLRLQDLEIRFAQTTSKQLMAPEEDVRTMATISGARALLRPWSCRHWTLGSKFDPRTNFLQICTPSPTSWGSLWGVWGAQVGPICGKHHS